MKRFVGGLGALLDQGICPGIHVPGLEEADTTAGSCVAVGRRSRFVVLQPETASLAGWRKSLEQLWLAFCCWKASRSWCSQCGVAFDVSWGHPVTRILPTTYFFFWRLCFVTENVCSWKDYLNNARGCSLHVVYTVSLPCNSI